MKEEKTWGHPVFTTMNLVEYISIFLMFVIPLVIFFYLRRKTKEFKT
jgi:hypothetical protein